MQCVDSILADIRKGRLEPDFTLFHRMLDYLSGFLYRYHHPKEDAYLFPALRDRNPSLTATLEELNAQHARGQLLLGGVHDTLLRYEELGAEAFEDFAAAVAAYHAFERQHMRREEQEVLPAAADSLPEEELQRLASVFADHDDPLFGAAPSDDFRRLYSEIVSRAPAPYGVGPASRP